jgi:hypothetical protein
MSANYPSASRRPNVISSSWDESRQRGIWGQAQERRKFAGHDDTLLCFAISPNGWFVASAGWDEWNG